MAAATPVVVVALLVAGPALGGAGPNWEQFRSAQVNLYKGLYLSVLVKLRVDYTLARGPLRHGAQLRTVSVGPGPQSTCTKGL